MGSGGNPRAGHPHHGAVLRSPMKCAAKVARVFDPPGSARRGSGSMPNPSSGVCSMKFAALTEEQEAPAASGTAQEPKATTKASAAPQKPHLARAKTKLGKKATVAKN